MHQLSHITCFSVVVQVLVKLFIKSNTITKYPKRVIKYHGHNLDQAEIHMTVSTEKATTGITENTVLSALHLPMFKPEKQFC